MKLLTHNMLACHIKGVKNNYPFKIEAEEVVEREADFDPGEMQWKKGHQADECVCVGGGGRSKVCHIYSLGSEGQHTLQSL